MTKYNYYFQGKCIGISLARGGAVFEKCENRRAYEKTGCCEGCLHLDALMKLRIAPISGLESNAQLNFEEEN